MNLTQQQIKILRFIACGETQKDIAKLMNISKPQMYLQVKDIIKKLSARNKTEAAVKAVLLNLI